MNKLIKKIEFRDGGKFVEDILITLGKKTKINFSKELLNEWDNIKSKTHQYMLPSDIIRVADQMKIEVPSK